MIASDLGLMNHDDHQPSPVGTTLLAPTGSDPPVNSQPDPSLNTSTLPTVAQQDSEPRKAGVFNLLSLFIKLLR